MWARVHLDVKGFCEDFCFELCIRNNLLQLNALYVNKYFAYTSLSLIQFFIGLRLFR